MKPQTARLSILGQLPFFEFGCLASVETKMSSSSSAVSYSDVPETSTNPNTGKKYDTLYSRSTTSSGHKRYQYVLNSFAGLAMFHLLAYITTAVVLTWVTGIKTHADPPHILHKTPNVVGLYRLNAGSKYDILTRQPVWYTLLLISEHSSLSSMNIEQVGAYFPTMSLQKNYIQA